MQSSEVDDNDQLASSGGTNDSEIRSNENLSLHSSNNSAIPPDHAPIITNDRLRLNNTTFMAGHKLAISSASKAANKIAAKISPVESRAIQITPSN